MKIVAGIFLVLFSFIGNIYFSKYKGTIIQYPFLWYSLFVLIGIIGFWLIITSFKKTDLIGDKSITEAINQFKLNAEKIELNFDHCEFKNGGYHHEVEDENIKTLSYMVPASAAIFHNPTKTEKVVQSYLVYTHQQSGNSQKYISQHFPVDETTLRYYVLSNKIALYISRNNQKDYLFDVE